MLTPTVCNRPPYFYAYGMTPAISLTRSVPRDQDATVLSLGAGDLHNVLYTAYLEGDLPKRNIDVTCCDKDEKSAGRNAVFLSFLLDENEALDSESLWDSYYHMFINNATIDALLKQTTKLLSMSSTLEGWEKNNYGHAIKFSDADTLTDARRVWQRINQAAEEFQKQAYMEEFDKNFRASKERHKKSRTNIGGLRSAAPLSLQAQDVAPLTWEQYWKDGTVTPKQAEAKFPNPLLIGLLSDHEILHHDSDPIQCFHLAAAYAPLVSSSPLNPTEAEKNLKPAAAAQTQFNEWISAAKKILGKTLVIRFACAEALAFCHTLQSVAEGSLSANLYRRPWDTKPLKVDEGTPTSFDLVDTSNLGHHSEVLSILAAAGPLLNGQPWATLFTRIPIRSMTEEHEEAKDSEELNKVWLRTLETALRGDVPTVTMLLGLSPVEYWTNAKCEPDWEQLVTIPRTSPTSARVAWKLDNQLSGCPEGRGKLHIDESSLYQLLLPIIRQMLGSNDSWKPEVDDKTHSYFQYESIAVLLKTIKQRVRTDWATALTRLFDLIAQDEGLESFDIKLIPGLGAQLYIMGVITQPWLKSHIKNMPVVGAFNGWNSIPEAVSVTLTVSRDSISRLCGGWNLQDMNALIFNGSLGGDGPWLSKFGDVHIAFGTPRKTSTPDKDDYEVSVEQDEAGWFGTAPLIASFYVPTVALQMELVLSHPHVKLMVQQAEHDVLTLKPVIDAKVFTFEESLADHENVFVTKYMPGQKGYPVVCAHAKESASATRRPTDLQGTTLMAKISESEERLTTITGHLDLNSEKAKTLLEQKVPIELRYQNPFVVDVVFDRTELICSVRFPIPVEKDGIMTRVARKSGYFEVIATIARPGVSKELADLAFPSALSLAHVPCAMNVPHLNLDFLPIIDVQSEHDKLRWLTTLTSIQFSDREKQLREQADERSGISPDLRLNFKESLFTMFMLASGAQGGQTGLFAINNSGKGGIHMLIFVSALRLDGECGSVVLDAAVIPFTTEMIASGEMETFLLVLRELECCSIEVNDEELILWKKVLPSLVERCRTWSHRDSCEYKDELATVPLSLKEGDATICSCGNGKIPDNFMGLPEWETAVPNAVRVAISPLYAMSYVEHALALEPGATEKGSQDAGLLEDVDLKGIDLSSSA
ncbi:hypothetical protein B0T10DRAFT_511490 [Thelonectria olida]|uniref:DUF4470 domain-containing protein n=1 Tax=Thelonectria olida TaxID=1576542 RepID=A0A9P9ATG0_9HYPO|nr:hypothetical protein B0T10DRAFT_511490 [Thelonectria olida]